MSEQTTRPLSPQRLAHARAWVNDSSTPDDEMTATILCEIADDLLSHVDHLTAENARLREGVEELAETGEADGRGNSRDLARHLRTLLNPPTKGDDRADT